MQRPFTYYPWSLLPPRAHLSRYGFWPADIAPPGYLPRILHEEEERPREEERRRRLWQEETAAVIVRLWSQQLQGIDPSPVELALLSGDDGMWWIRRHRAAGVDDLYAVWRREQQPLPWRVPVNVRMAPSPEGEWGRRRYEPGSPMPFLQDRERRVERAMGKLYRKA